MAARLLSEIRRRRVLRLMAPYAVIAWLVIQITATIGPALAMPHWVSSLVVILSIAGFPVVLYVAWFFDITPQGLVRTPKLDETHPVHKLGMARWLGFGATVTLALAASYIAVGLMIDGQNRDGTRRLAALPEDKSIAVLPFDDLSPAQDLGYLAQGIAEEVTVALGKLGGIRIAAPQSAFRAAISGADNRAIGKQLGVAAILQGSVRTSGDRLRVTAALVNAADGLTIWTDAFSRTLTDVMTVEEQIARTILGIMLDRFLDDDNDLLGKPVAGDSYDLYLRGRAAMRKRTVDSLREARTFFDQAISADGENAAAYTGLAATILLLGEGSENFGTLDPAIAATIARNNVDKTLMRDPNMAEAHAVLGRIEDMEGNAPAALDAYAKAIALNPSYADAYLWQSLLLARQSRHKEAMDSLETAFSLDPLSPVVLYNIGFQKGLRGHPQEARKHFNALLELSPGSPLGLRGLADIARREGNLAESAQFWKQALAASPDSTQYRESLTATLLSLGMPDMAGLYASQDFRINLMLARGQFKEALAELDFAVEANPDDSYVALEAGWYALLYGVQEQAADFLLTADSALPDEERFYMPYCSPAIEAAYIYQERGAQDEAQSRLQHCTELLFEERKYGLVSAELDYLSARINALEGRNDEAISALNTAYDHGWREDWTPRDPLLFSLRDMSGYQDIMDKITADLGRQRQILTPIAANWSTEP
ncbi:hypothetical protein JCM17844_18920 [Iodidimonas gelatinilytica]|uniref:Tetratricopeptide repeat protein n=1 Tax=Iodidimonas gelatinilytica TaxID=1236966 RepID=A0A5A7MTE6_9PROT|nr:tetratricopeptide repeat protein [Iodidimonas gelatinilytica]GEQ98255.1 hypothetical protein JCM17844_18920 [Iodidimonas gelatinilytica]